MGIIRTKSFRRREWVCRLCGARSGGDPEKERTICSCTFESPNPLNPHFPDTESFKAAEAKAAAHVERLLRKAAEAEGGG